MQIASATSVIPELAPVRWERDLSLTGRRAMTLRLNRAGNDGLKTYIAGTKILGIPWVHNGGQAVEVRPARGSKSQRLLVKLW
jgi:hypothetical protein